MNLVNQVRKARYLGVQWRVRQKSGRHYVFVRARVCGKLREAGLGSTQRGRRCEYKWRKRSKDIRQAVSLCSYMDQREEKRHMSGPPSQVGKKFGFPHFPASLGELGEQVFPHFTGGTGGTGFPPFCPKFQIVPAILFLSDFWASMRRSQRFPVNPK